VIDHEIARGGCGAVYVAEHRVIARRAALKILHRELAEIPEMVERFVREARAVNLIRHPNIVDIFDFGTTQDGRPYFVLELLEGRDLDSLLRTDGRLSPDETFEILDQVCAALSCAHEAGFVHRDLKAANVVVIQNADQRIAKLLDFGIAKLLQPDPALASLTT